MAAHDEHRFTPSERTPVVGTTTARSAPEAPGLAGPYPGTVAAPVLTYRNTFGFDLEPERLWQQIEAVDQFETWWPWLTDFRIEGGGLAPGSVLSGTVSPPLPYRMRIRIRLEGCERPTAIDADVDGDLVGDAHLRFRPQEGRHLSGGRLGGRDASAGHAAGQPVRSAAAAVGTRPGGRVDGGRVSAADRRPLTQPGHGEGRGQQHDRPGHGAEGPFQRGQQHGPIDRNRVVVGQPRSSRPRPWPVGAAAGPEC